MFYVSWSILLIIYSKALRYTFFETMKNLCSSKIRATYVI